MAYKLKGGCTPITAKIKHTTKGGITQPLLNVGSPVKMKASTPDKQTRGEYTNISFADYRKSGLMKPEEAKFYTGRGTKRVKTADLPTLTSNKPKEKKKSEYTNLTFAEYRKSGLMKPEEAKFYTGGGTKRVKTSSLSARSTPEPESKTKTTTKPTTKPVKRKVSQTEVSTITPKKEVFIETKKPTASIDVSTLKPKASKITNERAAKRSEIKTAKAQKVRQKGIEALESGNLTKARRLKRREARINKRAEKQLD